ncbi:hypothetical protein ABES02_22150 [Neobacillus pocheonensis]|uniref:hypothetical protein n=1 Tax=Neobacillus pocheonensis TaxID=363869 RepID=UPI003D2DA442
MRRGEFLKEMRSSLFQTVKSVYEPFLNEDLEKVEAAADRALGIAWLPLTEVHTDLELKFIGGTPIIVSRNGTNMQAWNGVCPECSHIIILTTLYSSGKCLNCQKEFNFKTKSGDLLLNSIPIKQKENAYYIGFEKHMKLGGLHA